MLVFKGMSKLNESNKGKRVTLYYRWASGRIEMLRGTVLANIESPEEKAGVLLRYHDWNTGVTAERFFKDNEIANYITHY